ncbi:hypothetical protein ANCDUO_10082 [Ancylostoma duodenale]|uniref:Peptidase M1 membrane alanine aminopeptidase domain-containing protein n=1 Tax=Ancylostoma duodenale TaxID=51022 RepID=A0A0C2CS59_9BILA|nr:hypothetical protein ANCDUO_10082 [Ancylostoma duodenale]
MSQELVLELKVVAGAVDYMSKYLKYPFPLSKLDLVALPQHANRGETENWGLIVGNYERMMVDMAYADVATLSDVAITLAHGVVHQVLRRFEDEKIFLVLASILDIFSGSVI